MAMAEPKYSGLTRGACGHLGVVWLAVWLVNGDFFMRPFKSLLLRRCCCQQQAYGLLLPWLFLLQNSSVFSASKEHLKWVIHIEHLRMNLFHRTLRTNSGQEIQSSVSVRMKRKREREKSESHSKIRWSRQSKKCTWINKLSLHIQSR